MKTKAKLNPEVRIKKNQNYLTLEQIKKDIWEKVMAKYEAETKALRRENELLYEQELLFKNIAEKVLRGLKTDTQIKVITQVGKNQSVFQTHTGTIQKLYSTGDGHFNMIDDSYNDGNPFTIGLSCLQLIMKL